MSISFVLWAMANFKNRNFAVCGRTIGSVKRNILFYITDFCAGSKYRCVFNKSENIITIGYKNYENRFYIFGGRDEAAAKSLQGITLAGILFDEVALMPESFVSQGIARCSVDGSVIWFNCNPEHPEHWFYKSWILKHREKNALYLHFDMDDNPSLSKAIRNRYKKLYSGIFYKRYIKGQWCAAFGMIYDFFDKDFSVVEKLPEGLGSFYLSCDYGTKNPFSCGLWGFCGGVWYRIREYYFDSRARGFQKTDEEYYADIKKFCEGYKIEKIFIDPSAASFIECVRRHGDFKAVPAVNDVGAGIRRTADMLKSGKIKISSECKNFLSEIYDYIWDRNGSDKPRKVNDHAMDDMRYFVSSHRCDYDDFFITSSSR